MKIAIMQPYFFPYIGYFQLIAAVDKFVIYDDVNFINRGWINRNNILVGGKPLLITLPLKEASQNKKILEVLVTNDNNSVEKLLKTIAMNYKKAPYFDQVYELIRRIFTISSISVSELNLIQIKTICNYLVMDTEIIPSSVPYSNHQLKGQERIIDICIQEKADTYINPIGGLELYERSKFEAAGIELFFIKSLPIEYRQFNHSFVPWLSIIDVLMFNDIEKVRGYLQNYELI